jgi:hypothetical protein
MSKFPFFLLAVLSLFYQVLFSLPVRDDSDKYKILMTLFAHTMPDFILTA